MAARSWKTEAVVLRSIRYGEADRVLHLFTLARGRVGAIAKGARKTTSRFGGRLEPFSHVQLVLHEGRGELHTVTQADLVRSHDASRVDPYRMAVGHVGLEAVLRLFLEGDVNERAFFGLVRFLDLLDEAPSALPARPSLDPLVLAFQLKLLWLSGYLPHLSGCASCGADAPPVGFSPAAGGAVCAACEAGSLPVTGEGFTGLRLFLERPLDAAHAAGVSDRGRRDALRVVESSYEYHGGFRLRTLARRA
ncbi:MAG: DNA repair protein RecO [Thermoleophilia bacterium]|nr:DNA repair protein RecO [Thermoleophilia bacterium]